MFTMLLIVFLSGTPTIYEMANYEDRDVCTLEAARVTKDLAAQGFNENTFLLTCVATKKEL